jgi:hypothetical protein
MSEKLDCRRRRRRRRRRENGEENAGRSSRK